MKSEEVKEIAAFIAEYAACLLGSGVHTSRVIRNSGRIGESLGVEIRMTTLHKTFVLTVSEETNGHSFTRVVDIPAFGVNFDFNASLSSLSWEAFDGRLPLETIRFRYGQILSRGLLSPWVVLGMVSLANAAFCKLFAGDWVAAGVVGLATAIGFFIRLEMQRRHINHFITFTLSAFVSSLCASLCLWLGHTPEIALATSVLYLIPGVPLVNGVIDIVEGHTLTGFSRLIQAVLLVICIACGLSCSLLLVKNSLL
ncbi:MAG: threonine/serine exporter family protein [Tannerellaceae bacterium]|jgi:uncharacterized membrane protein YjjP (DUF1212 family)|nr:threonine/serine exporter family protein [Tannerellaceae bacterium]